MKTLHTHNEEMEKEFDEILKLGRDLVSGGAVISSKAWEEDIKNFITNQNKQLYIKIAEREIERLNGDLWTKENCPITKMEYELQGVEFIQGEVEGHNKAIQYQILYWNNILQELNK